MKKRINFRLTVSFMLGLLVAFIGGALFGGLTGLPVAPTVGISMGTYTVVNILDISIPNFRAFTGFYVSPLVTIFARDIQENLFPDNSFYRRSINDDAFVSASKVNLPQAG